MKKTKWRVWYLKNKRCRKALCVEVMAFGKNDAYAEAEESMGFSAVFLNAFEVKDDDGI